MTVSPGWKQRRLSKSRGTEIGPDPAESVGTETGSVVRGITLAIATHHGAHHGTGRGCGSKHPRLNRASSTSIELMNPPSLQSNTLSAGVRTGPSLLSMVLMAAGVNAR